MNVSILIATRGDQSWAVVAERRALPSARQQPALEVLHRHGHDNEPLHVTRNRLAREASGEWLCFLDGDDELEGGYLAAMRHAAQGAPSDGTPAGDTAPHTAGPWAGAERAGAPLLLVPAVQAVATTGVWAGASTIPAWDRHLLDVNCAVIGTLVPRELFDEVGGFRDFPIYEDWELWIRCVVAGARMLPAPRAVYLAHESPRGRNRAAEHAGRVYERVRQDHAQDWDLIGRCKLTAP